MTQSFLDIPGLYEEKEDVLQVIKELTVQCFDCRLGHIQKSRGLIWRGNPNAKMALVSIMPGPTEMVTGKPLTGESGKEGDKWLHYIGLDTNKDMLVINVVQCKPPDVDKGDEVSQREPDRTELATCFPNRCLRVLRAMPNLEVIITMGWIAASCFLGRPASEKDLGVWSKTTLLPGKALFPLFHPAALLREPSPDKKGKIQDCMENFKREYLDSNKVMDIVFAHS